MHPDQRDTLLAFDRLSMRHYDADERLHVDLCNLSKAAVNPYYGREIPDHVALGLDPTKMYKMYRDPAELAKAAPTFNNMPLLIAHVVVNADDPKQELTIGTIGSDAHFEAPYLKASIAVWTADAIALIESKKQAQLSCSYRYTPDMTPGVSDSGIAYDGVMRDIVANHVALVEEGRAGPDVYVSDSNPFTEILKMSKHPKRAAVLKLLVPTVTADQITAFDAAMEEEEEAMDGEACTPEEKAAKDKKAAADKAAADAKAAKDAEALEVRGTTTGAALDAALAAGTVVSKADTQKMVNDAQIAAVAAVNELHAARDLVKPIVGVVAMDSAEAVYRFALDTAKVDHKDVHASALKSLVSLAVLTASKPAARVAMDSASAASVGKALGFLGNYSRA